MAKDLATIRHLPVFEPHHPLCTNRYLHVRHHRPRRDLHVCTALGEIDLCTVALLEQELSLAQRRSVRSLVVDLSQVEFIGGVGVSALLAAAQHAARCHRSFTLVVDTPPVRRVLDLTEVSRQIVSYRSLSEALDAPSSCGTTCR
ncbi:MAG: STAS domain-containing protein [Labedaea sp.]